MASFTKVILHFSCKCFSIFSIDLCTNSMGPEIANIKGRLYQILSLPLQLKGVLNCVSGFHPHLKRTCCCLHFLHIGCYYRANFGTILLGVRLLLPRLLKMVSRKTVSSNFKEALLCDKSRSYPAGESHESRRGGKYYKCFITNDSILGLANK